MMRGGLVRAGAVFFLAVLAGGCAGEPEPTPEVQGSEILDRITRPTDGGAVHLVRLVQRGDAYAFDPSDIAIASGDVVRFVMTGSQPESVAFSPEGAAPEVADYIRQQGLDRGVLLTEPGSAHDVSFPAAPPGSYPFHSVPHAAQGMRGSIQVESP